MRRVARTVCQEPHHRMNSPASTIPVSHVAWWQDSSSKSLRASLAAQIALTGFISGHSCLPNHWLHLGWLFVTGVCAMCWTDWTQKQSWKRVDAGFQLIAVFLLWMTVRSCFSDAYAPEEMQRGLVGTGLLMLFCILIWQQSGDGKTMRIAGWAIGVASTLAAFISIALTYFVLPGHHVGERLTNLLVHGGLNPVCTGLIFGFTAVWLAALVETAPAFVPRRFVWAAMTLLHFATFLSGSRGAMLALVCGHAALFIVRGWRRGAAALGVLFLTGTVYFTSASLLANFSSRQHQPTTLSITHHFHKVVERGDNGRFDIYRAGWNAMDNLWLGTGQWGVRDVWQCELQPNNNSMASHLHSAIFATFVHGGFIGAVLLLVLLACGIRRAWRISLQGDATWIALLAFGCGGLLFDGESLASLATAPRFEGLLFWLPLTVALACGSVTAPTRTV